jgi:hypothetical protein
LLWILALAEARSAVPISAAISAKRATKASAKINATLEGARQKGSWLRRSFVTAPCGDAPHSLLAICPSASTRDPSQHFNSLLGRGQMGASSLDPSFEALVQQSSRYTKKKTTADYADMTHYKARDWHAFLIAPTAIKVSRKKFHVS